MARSVQIQPRKAPTPEQKARATGRPLPPTAPAAVAIAGVRGQLPIPVNRPVVRPGGTPASLLTPLELQTLKAVDWKDGDPVPANLAEVIEKVKMETNDLLPPIDPSTPPLQVNTVQEVDLTPEQRSRVKQVLADYRTTNAQIAKAQEEARRQAAMGPGISQAIAIAAQQSANPAGLELVDDEAMSSEPPSAPAPSAPPATATAPLPAQPMAATSPTPPKECPHCGWDQTIEDPIVISETDEAAYLQAMIGQKQFVREYDMLRGNLRVVFRTLTMPEVDACYRQAFEDREKGLVPTELDFWERLNRYRFYLQLQQLRSSETMHDLPDGLEPDTNPLATAFWDVADLEGKATPLPGIERWLQQNVLRTESINRVLFEQCTMFNRLVAKLEKWIRDPNPSRPADSSP